ncbi:MAG: phosphoenolpyruvate synthase, partial [Microlunatus sp.]|nr:phosphoenolpyruvate synthase [Microlunatus sp.]
MEPTVHLDLPAPAWVLGLGVVGRDDVAAVGGKAANLGELIQAGLPVPPGFVVTTSAYRASVDASGHRDRILAAATPSPKDDFATAAATVGELFAAIDVPDDIVTAVTDAYCTLGSGAVAVRSSATAEDLAEASFAGQQDSYLNISGIKPLLEAVRRCWASLWTERALAYRARQGIDPADVSLAVVVQQLVDADASGVMFTADPATGQRDVVLISAAWGLGEAVVGGLVDPDQLTLTGHDPVVTSRQTADKAVQTVRTATGTAETPVPTERRRTAVLHDESARALARLGRRIERHYHAPQDIEWVWLGDPTTASGEPMIVQSRPITALPEPTGPVPTAWPVPDPRAYYFRASIVEQLPDPLTPLFAELINPAVTSSISVVMAEVLGREILRTGDVGLPTINGYAYYAYSREGLIRLLKLTPAAMRRAFGKHGINPRRRWETTARPMYQRAVDDWTARDLTSLASPDLL